MIQLVSIDLNGTMIHQHSMSGMIARFIPEYRHRNRYIRAMEKMYGISPSLVGSVLPQSTSAAEPMAAVGVGFLAGASAETYSRKLKELSNDGIVRKVKDAFHSQMNGKLSLLDAFGIAGTYTQGMSLRQFIEYVDEDITTIDGFYEFMAEFANRGIPVIVNSTGYRTTIVAIEAKFGVKFSGYINNDVKFEYDRIEVPDDKKEVPNNVLDELIREYFDNRDNRTNSLYDDIIASGRIDTGQSHLYNGTNNGTDALSSDLETSKAQLLRMFLRENFPQVLLSSVAHIDDTMGGWEGIVRVGTTFGGVGIAFNPNKALEDKLKEYVTKRQRRGLGNANLSLVDSKLYGNADLRHVLPYILQSRN